MTVQQARVQLENVKYLFRIGALTYDQAKKKACPFINAMNNKIIEISKKHGFKPKLIDFVRYMR
jgi:hypothetical protein